jgi:ABC-2 type transport system ATP-binding protein
VVEVEVYGIAADAVERVRSLSGVVAVAIEEREQAQVLVVQTEPEVELTQVILGHLDGSDVGRISRREPTLEDAYVSLVAE